MEVSPKYGRIVFRAGSLPPHSLPAPMFDALGSPWFNWAWPHGRHCKSAGAEGWRQEQSSTKPILSIGAGHKFFTNADELLKDYLTLGVCQNSSIPPNMAGFRVSVKPEYCSLTS